MCEWERQGREGFEGLRVGFGESIVKSVDESDGGVGVDLSLCFKPFIACLVLSSET